MGRMEVKAKNLTQVPQWVLAKNKGKMEAKTKGFL